MTNSPRSGFVRHAATRLREDPVARFVVLAGLGFLPVLVATVRGTNEIFDFWEHAATVRQLMLHPAHPGNPLLAINTPSAFFSPYLLAVAVAAKFSGTGPVHALAIAGLINYWLLMWGIWRFTRIFSSRPHAPFYALLFVWFLWGASPWKYSGFFNYRSLPSVIAYPSTFATACGMLIAAAWHHATNGPPRRVIRDGAGVSVGLAVVVLTHPIAGAMTAAALLAISLTCEERRTAVGGVILIGLLAGLLCLAWPYYSIVRLAGDQGAYNAGNASMYSGWVIRALPAFAVIGLVWYRTNTLTSRRLLIYLMPLALIYVWGDIAGHFSEGRVISPLVIGAQIGLADAAATVEAHRVVRVRGAARAALVTAVAVVGVAELFNMRGGFRGTFPGTGAAPTAYAAYREAVNGLPATATVLAPLNDGMEAAIPVYGGRLVATHRALAFVTDPAARQQTVDEFFSPAASTPQRRAVIAEYHVRYIVVSTVPATEARQLAALGTTIRTGPTFDTIEIAAQNQSHG